MDKHVIKFEKSRDTKGTYVYEEKTEGGMPPKVQTLYLKKWVLGDNPPQKLTVTIE